MQETCDVCGGKLVMIRGRYPGYDRRQVCPTCLKEKLELVEDILRPAYGVAMQEKDNES